MHKNISDVQLQLTGQCSLILSSCYNFPKLLSLESSQYQKVHNKYVLKQAGEETQAQGKSEIETMHISWKHA